jgi:hypothetical protein
MPSGFMTPIAGAGLAGAVSVLYALSIALLVIVAASFYSALAGQVPDANSASALGLILLVSIIAILLGSPDYDLSWLMVVILVLIAFVPLVLAVVVTLWAATWPSIEEANRRDPPLRLRLQHEPRGHGQARAAGAEPVGIAALAATIVS